MAAKMIEHAADTDVSSDSFGSELEVHILSILGEESLPPAVYVHRTTLSLVNKSQVKATSPVSLKFGSFCWGRSTEDSCNSSASKWILLQVFPALGSDQFKSATSEQSEQRIQCGLTHSAAQSLNIAGPGALVSLLLRSLSKEEIAPADSMTIDITISKSSPTPPPSNGRPPQKPCTYYSLPGERSLLRIARERFAGVAASPGMVAMASFGGQRWTLTVRGLVPGATHHAAADTPGKSPPAGAYPPSTQAEFARHATAANPRSRPPQRVTPQALLLFLPCMRVQSCGS
jgi:hypothetical protein